MEKIDLMLMQDLYRLETWDRRSVPAEMGKLGHIDVPGVPGVLGVPRQGVPGDPMLTVDDVRSTRPQVTFALQTLVTTRGRY